MSPLLIGIVADDLTGAMDTTGVLASRGLRSLVSLSPRLPPTSQALDALCINTQSRALPQDQAEAAVREATRRLVTTGCRVLYKKIDSTMRGHVAAEIRAALNASAAQTAFVCPAFPVMGRAVVDGVLHVDGRPVGYMREGRARHDDSTASIVRRLERGMGIQVGLVSLADVAAGASAVRARVDDLEAAGYRAIVLDAAESSHMDTIASAVGDRQDAILAGSAGLMTALSETIAPEGADDTYGADALSCAGPALLVSGSLSPVTRAQISALTDIPGLRRVPIGVEDALAGGAARVALLDRVVRDAAAALSSGEDAALYWDRPETVEAALEAHGGLDAASALESLLRDIARRVVALATVSALVLVGGETAHAVLVALDAQGVRPAYELAPGIVLGVVTGGAAHGALAVTKAGGFGEEAALSDVIAHIRRLRRR